MEIVRIYLKLLISMNSFLKRILYRIFIRLIYYSNSLDFLLKEEMISSLRKDFFIELGKMLEL